MKHFIFSVLLMTTLTAFLHGQVHPSSVHTSPFSVGSPLPSIRLGAMPASPTLADLSANHPIIVVRYRGYDCSHCVRQLTYLHEQVARLTASGIRIVAISDDDARTNAKLMQNMQFRPSVITLVSDLDNAAATQLGAVRVEGGKEADLHATLVISQNTVLFARYSEDPYMDAEAVIAAAMAAVKGPVVQSVANDPLGFYFTNKVTVRQIAGPNDGIRQPVDLEFNESALHGDDLWVVMREAKGNSMSILHHAGSQQQQVTYKKDSRAYHFMWRTMALSFGGNGAFATAENGQSGDGDAQYMFMGPTLWSADTSIFASKYQTSDDFLASHLDMLHQSPEGLGIAHERGNSYWILDNYYHDLVRYDFRDPHEVGGTDHRDGVIRRYSDVVIGRAQRNRPAHIALDTATNWLYYIDPATNSLHRLDIRSGSYAKNLTMPAESEEDVAEFSAYTNARVDSLFSIEGTELVGMDIKDGMLIVGDRLHGTIFVYDLRDSLPSLRGTLATGATELLGIEIGPDRHIWFVDRASGTVNRLETSAADVFTTSTDILYQQPRSTCTVRFTYTNTSSSSAVVDFTPTLRGMLQWTLVKDSLTKTIAAGASATMNVRVVLDSTHGIADVVVVAQRRDQITNYPALSSHAWIVDRSIQRMDVNDATTEEYALTSTIAATGRTSYVPVRSDLFLRIADSLQALDIVTWNSGSFGEITPADDAVISSLVARDVSMFLVADDPFLLRGEQPHPDAFFAPFGVVLFGAEVGDTAEPGRRIFDGVTGDSISNGMQLIDCELPRLDHHRGGKYVPNVRFRLNGSAVTKVLVGHTSKATTSARNERPFWRGVIMGTNLDRFLSDADRTAYVDKTLAWLERTPRRIPTDVADPSVSARSHTLTALGNPFTDGCRIRVTTATDIDQATVALYAVTGQLLATLHQGQLPAGVFEVDVDGSRLAAGTYFVVLRTATLVDHVSIVKR